jgi:hypothetical protein
MVFSAAGSLAQYREPFYQNPGHGRSGVVQDIIDIHLVENELIGIVEGRREYRLDLDLGEKIVWRAARGEVGAVLTDSRALALSGASRGWAELSLKLQEADRVAFIKPFISDYLVMLVTGRRIIGFDSGKSYGFAYKQLRGCSDHQQARVCMGPGKNRLYGRKTAKQRNRSIRRDPAAHGNCGH